MKSIRRKWLRNSLVALLVFVIVVFIGGFIYTSDYYRTSTYVATMVESSAQEIIVEGSLTTIYPNSNADMGKGFIFYPGGKVEASAYMPLMIQLAEKGLTCVLVEMPLNLAVLNIDAVDGILQQYPKVDGWYLAGHSLGGAMASSYVEENFDQLEGLILLAAYPLNDVPIGTMVIYGTNDILLDQEKLSIGKGVYAIEGGNHASLVITANKKVTV